jgi:surface antigen
MLDERSREQAMTDVTKAQESVLPASVSPHGLGETSPQQVAFPTPTASFSQLEIPIRTRTTGLLADTDTKLQTTSLREPIFISGNGKKRVSATQAPQKRRLFVHATVTILLVAIVAGALIAVLPTGSSDAKSGSLFQPIMNMITSKKSNTALIASQAATATAVTQDGYDAGNQAYAGVQSGPANTTSSSSSSSTGSMPVDSGADLDRFFYGQCTYWANMRYGELTGHYVPWLGNAYQWSSQAAAYGWVVSSEPNPNGPSIIVLQPGVQYAGSYGHVAVVEQGEASADNGVLTSNWNWDGEWATESWVTFYSGPGVSFIWY